jgi:prepilin-type N-terminal cleavage/methylation domain-containing protein
MTSRSPSFSRRGFSLVEMLIVVAILGIISAVTIPGFQSSYKASQAAMARNLVETLNTAVYKFNEGNYELILTADPTTANDEMAILRTLQYRSPVNPVVGTPYLPPRWNPVTSSSTSDYRAQWTGTLFKLLLPGTTGFGLKLVFDASDLTTPYVFPTGYTIVGH